MNHFKAKARKKTKERSKNNNIIAQHRAVDGMTKILNKKI